MIGTFGKRCKYHHCSQSRDCEDTIVTCKVAKGVSIDIGIKYMQHSYEHLNKSNSNLIYIYIYI